jgi:glutamate synthase (NADPH/NADH) small chain
VKPLGIGYLERFVADYEQQMGTHVIPKIAPTGKKVAVVGSGPSGLTVAGDLIQKGHKVRVFEALHEIGGVLSTVSPNFACPSRSCASKSITCARWALSSKPTSLSAAL